MLSDLYKPFTVRILSYVTSQKKIEDSWLVGKAFSF